MEERIQHTPFYDVSISGEPRARDLRYDTLTTPESLITIATKVAQRLGRKLSRSEFDKLVHVTRQTNYRQFQGKTDDDIQNLVAHNFIRATLANNARPAAIDIHETLKREIGSTSEDASRRPYVFSKVTTDVVYAEPGVTGEVPDEALESDQTTDIVSAMPNASQWTETSFDTIRKIYGTPDAYALLKLWAPDAVASDDYLLFDTRYRVIQEVNGDRLPKFVFSLHNSADVREGSVNYIAPIRDITEIDSYSFQIPYIAAADTSERRVSLLVEEIQHQSVIAHENRRFHFLFDTEIQGNRIKLTPVGNSHKAQYRFNLTITKLDRFTLSFGAPLQLIIFDPDRLLMTPTYGVNPATFTTLNAIPHNLINGDIVYFTNFTTNTPVINNTIIAQVNRTTGHAVTVTGATTFTIPISLIGTVAPAGGGVITVFFGSKRIQIPMHFVFQRPQETIS